MTQQPMTQQPMTQRSINSSPSISSSVVDEYQTNGAVLIKNLFSEEWLLKIEKGIEVNKNNPSPRAVIETNDGTSFFQDLWNWRNVKEFEDFIFNSPAAETAATLMKIHKPVFYHEHVLVRESGCKKKTIWHHDQPYFPIDGDVNVSLWIPTDPVSKHAGMRLVKGSHRWGKWFHPKKFSTRENYPLIEDGNSILEKTRKYDEIPSDLDDDDNRHNIMSWDCEPGDCVAFHMRTLHAVGSNQDSIQRRVLSLRWVGEDGIFVPRPWDVPIPLSMYGSLQFGDEICRNQEAFPTIDIQ